jgi:hypothetical protein
MGFVTINDNPLPIPYLFSSSLFHLLVGSDSSAGRYKSEVHIFSLVILIKGRPVCSPSLTLRYKSEVDAFSPFAVSCGVFLVFRLRS